MQSFSWEGEDVLARKILIDVFGMKHGRYLDIGAHHPFNLSNTALFYSEGWRGINVDAMPGSMEEFKLHRPEDVNIESPVAPTPGVLRFTVFNDPGLNGFVDDQQIEAHKLRGIEVLGQFELQCKTVESLLNEHCVSNIDLMSIDVEGLDGEILATFPFHRVRPKLIITEVLACHSASDVKRTLSHKVLRRKGYMLFSRLHMSCIYIDRAAYCSRISSRERPVYAASWISWMWVRLKIKMGLLASY